MRRVITVNLGGNAFALDEDAYERLRAYVSLTEARLGTNPDRAEILSDLERAVAEHIVAERGAADSTVVSDATMQSALAKVGTVEHMEGVDAPDRSLHGGLPSGASAASAGAQERPAAGAQTAYASSSASAAAGSSDSEYTRLVMLLLCVIVGIFGVHRFFVGKVGTGVLQLVTLGGLGIWALVDLILILCGEFKDKDGRKIVRWV